MADKVHNWVPLYNGHENISNEVEIFFMNASSVMRYTMTYDIT